MVLEVREFLRRFPFRISVTDYCNIRCFFCSNEGMVEEKRGTKHIERSDFNYLAEVLVRNGLTNLSMTGGEPTLHPEIEQLVEDTERLKVPVRFFHTNGIALTPNLIKLLSGFSKVAVSIHAGNYETWRKINRGSEEQYCQLSENLNHLGTAGFGERVEIKHVPMNGINFSSEALGSTLELCSKYGFRFKFLNLEPMDESQSRLVVPIVDLRRELTALGCVEEERDQNFRGQSAYLPITRYKYKNSKGVAIEIGCGDKKVCRACYDSNEIFVTPELTVKPCHVSNYSIPLTPLIKARDEKGILEAIVNSRRFLMLKKPGEGVETWRVNE